DRYEARSRVASVDRVSGDSSDGKARQARKLPVALGALSPAPEVAIRLFRSVGLAIASRLRIHEIEGVEMTSETLADYLQIWGTEGDFIVYADGSIGFAFDLVPLDVSCLSDDAVNEIASKGIRFLNSLPPEIDLQLVQDINAGNGERIKEHASLAACAV